MLPLPKSEDDPVASPGPHQPVMLREALHWLAPRPGAMLVDATLGAGGHSEAILEAIGPSGRVYGIDRDPQALELARQRLERFGSRFHALRGNHSDLKSLLDQAGVKAVDGILFDLGVSSLQLDDAARGFSFRREGPLDMRMDPESGQTAARLLAEIDERELRGILREYGEEKQAAAIARAIVRRRDQREFTTTIDLAEVVEEVLGPRARRFKIHPATRTFQALRIAVNREIEDLQPLIGDAADRLRTGGRLVVIAYHSLEDRAVKRGIRALAHRCVCPPRLPVCGCGRENLVRALTSKPLRPTLDEVAENPRSRSAKLRAAERL